MTDSSKSRFRFTEEFDIHLAREVYGQNPFEDSRRWSVIQVNMIQITGKCVSIRTLRERMQNLIKKYSAKAASLVGKSGIEILVTEMDDLLQQILEIKNDNQKKKDSKSNFTKSSYMKGHDAREQSCSGNNSNYDTELSLENSRAPYSKVLDVPEQSCSDTGNDMIYDTTEIPVDDILKENVTEISSNEDSEATPYLSTQGISQPKNMKKRKPLAQANILGPKQKRCNSNIKQQTIQYLEKKNDKQYEVKCTELALQERKLKLEEQKFEMDRHERQKRLEIDERRLDMEEKRLKVELGLFVNQQDLIKILLKKLD